MLDEREVRALWRAAHTEPFPFGPLTRLLLLTGASDRGEVGEMRWTEIDFVARVWRLPSERSKNAREHVVPLPDVALDIVRSLPRIEESDLVFTTNGVTPVSGFDWAKRRLHRTMEGRSADPSEQWSYHDIRRSVATHMASIAISPHVIEAVLNHKSGAIKGVAAVYNRFQYQPEQRAALEAWARRLHDIATGERAENVVTFRR